MIDYGQYPQPSQECLKYTGVVPLDFIIEVMLEEGIEWFRNDPEAPEKVYSNLRRPILENRYGESKIIEIGKYIRDTSLIVSQSFPTGDERSPSISVNLANGAEHEQLASLENYGGDEDVLGPDEVVVSRKEVGYSPIRDDLLIGVHAVGMADKVKYIHQLVLYILNTNRVRMESEGLFNVTFRSTDLSRLNDYLPQNMFSRFVTFSAWSFTIFPKGEVPIMQNIEVEIDTDFEEGNNREIGG